MRPIAVVGEAGGLADRLVDHLGDEGTVARIDHRERRGDGGVETAPPEGAGVTYRIGDDGTWAASGEGLTLDAALDRVAPDHDYAVVSGYDDVDLPGVVVGDADHAGETLVSASTAEAVDLATVRDRLEGVEPHETLSSLVARVKRSEKAPLSGAIATFTGRVRAREHPGDDPTEFLEFEKYDAVAAERTATICEELEEREGVLEVAMHHRTGVVEYGEDIVFVVVLAGHREEAFRTVEDGIDRLKEEVPIFKREVTVEEEFWVHERE